MNVGYTKPIPSRWSDFPITHSWKDIICEFDVLLTTKTLSLNVVPDRQTERHRIITDLYGKGFNDRQIAKYLNDQDIKTPRGGDYYAKLVWVTRKKIREREARRNPDSHRVQVFNMRFLLRRIPLSS